MKNYFIIITYTSIILGMVALFSALAQVYQQNVYDHNVQRLIDVGEKLQAVVVEKKEVEVEYTGTFSLPKKSVQQRIYIKIAESSQQGKIVWQVADPKVYGEVAVGDKVNAYLNKDDVFIEELKHVEHVTASRFLLAAFGLFCLAVLANIKSKNKSS